MFLLGKALNDQKRLWYALRVFEGFGLATARRVCDQLCIHPFAKVKDVTESQVERLKETIQPMLEAQRQSRLLRLKMSKSMPKPILPS